MPSPARSSRRCFPGSSAAAVGAAGAILGAGAPETSPAAEEKTGAASSPPEPDPTVMPYGMLGNVKLSRLLLGGNLVGGYMHARDLKYVNRLFRAYVTEEKILQTFKLAEENGINTVFESGAALVRRYNEEYGRNLQIIPGIHPELNQDDRKLQEEIKGQVDAGVPALYIWGVAGDRLVQAGAVDRIAKAVEYVKTLHGDDYPSATPKELRKEYIWLDGGKGWHDNMWCIDPEETIEFMQTVAKPWIAFKVLAAGAIEPRQGFAHAFRNGADFIAVGMFDFQIEEDCELVRRLVSREKNRKRPWRA